MTLGEKIRLLREELELSQESFGAQLHMTQRKVSYMERDCYEPSIEDIRAICRYCNVSADYLLGLPNHLPYPHR